MAARPRHDALDVRPAGTGSAHHLVDRISGLARRLAAELADPEGGSPLAAVTAARELAAVSQAALQTGVDQARAAGHSWREIGDVLETTRQAAFQRFGRPIDPRSGQPMARAIPPGRIEQAIAVFTDLAAGQFADACRDFSPDMIDQAGQERVTRVYTQVVGTIGGFEAVGDPSAVQLDQITLVRVPLFFEAGERIGHVSFDAGARVVGLFIRAAADAG